MHRPRPQAGGQLGWLRISPSFVVPPPVPVEDPRQLQFVFAVAEPVRQAYLNDMIPSKQRATVLSFDSLFGSLGGVFIQPALGRSADIWGYGTWTATAPPS